MQTPKTQRQSYWIPDAIPKKRGKHTFWVILSCSCETGCQTVLVFGYLRNCFRGLEIYCMLILSAVLAFIPRFPEGSGRSENAKVNLRFHSSRFFYFLLSFSNHAYSGNKRLVSSLERLITGL